MKVFQVYLKVRAKREDWSRHCYRAMHQRDQSLSFSTCDTVHSMWWQNIFYKNLKKSPCTSAKSQRRLHRFRGIRLQQRAICCVCTFTKVGATIIPREARFTLNSQPRNANDIIIAAALIVSVYQDDRSWARAFSSSDGRCDLQRHSNRPAYPFLTDKDYQTDRKRSLVSRKSWLGDA